MLHGLGGFEMARSTTRAAHRDGLRRRGAYDGVPVIELTALDAPTLAGWLSAELRPGENAYAFHVLDARFRAPSDAVELDAPSYSRVPCVDGWLDAFGVTLPSEQPVTILVTQGGNRVSLAAHWSPWLDAESPVSVHLRNALDAMMAAGWTVTFRSAHWQSE